MPSSPVLVLATGASPHFSLPGFPLIRTFALSVCTLAGCFAWGLQSSPAAAERWKAPDPAELALAAPAIDEDADAEILEWDVRVAEEFENETPGHDLRPLHPAEDLHGSRPRYLWTGRSDLSDDVTSSASKHEPSPRMGRSAKCARRTSSGGRWSRATTCRSRPSRSPCQACRRDRSSSTAGGSSTADALAANLRLSMQREVPVHVVRYHIKPLGLEDMGYGCGSRAFRWSCRRSSARRTASICSRSNGSRRFAKSRTCRQSARSRPGRSSSTSGPARRGSRRRSGRTSSSANRTRRGSCGDRPTRCAAPPPRRAPEPRPRNRRSQPS